MKEFSNKTPYLAPQLTVVEFRVEKGYADSDLVELSTGTGGVYNEVLNQMMFGARQNNSDSHMGGAMGSYYGDDYFGSGTTQDGSYF